jgi:hypothetical protein
MTASNGAVYCKRRQTMDNATKEIQNVNTKITLGFSHGDLNHRASITANDATNTAAHIKNKLQNR